MKLERRQGQMREGQQEATTGFIQAREGHGHFGILRRSLGQLCEFKGAKKKVQEDTKGVVLQTTLQTNTIELQTLPFMWCVFYHN